MGPPTRRYSAPCENIHCMPLYKFLGWWLPQLGSVKYHGRGGPWLRRGLWHEASGTTDGEFNSARARLWRDSRGTSNTRTHRKFHRNRGCLLLPWRVYPWAPTPSQGRDTGPAHRVLSRSRCADFAKPITWVPNCSRASRYLKRGRSRADALHPTHGGAGNSRCFSFRFLQTTN